MNYFEFYELEPRFFLDEKDLKKRYVRKSRSSHPDFHMGSSSLEQEEMMELTSFNNRAYDTLKDFYARMRYIISMYLKETSNQLAPEFLMEMMDLNEEVMEISMDFDAEKAENIVQQLRSEENNMLSSIKDNLHAFDYQSIDNNILKEAEQFLLKRNYLLRIKENLDKFARTS